MGLPLLEAEPPATAGRPGTASLLAPAAPLPPVALYVHFPFCVSLCPYCDFVVIAGAGARGPGNRIAAFVAALRTEIGLRADALDERFEAPGTGGRPPLGSLYLGGGTPSLLPADELAGLIELVDERFGLERGAEVTLEVNPGPDERGEAAAQHRAGVTRLSIGAQSEIPSELRRLGRRHRPIDVATTVAAAREGGVGSVSLDLLYDIPDQSVSTWMASLEEALGLGPDHLSVYGLTLDDPEAEGLTGPDGDHLPTQRGARRWREDARPAQDEDRAAAMYHHAVVRLGADGWRGYEISNWARPGHESRHNLAYWQRLPYEAVGPGAHAFDGLTRRWNAARLDAYVAALTPPDGSSPRLPPGDAETLDPATAATEAIILGLRTDLGVAIAALHDPVVVETVAWARGLELVTVDPDDRVRLTTRGRLLSNELFARLV
ncbi:MAG TPA: coproporphyrinogen-III oxidase family protein [Candidatus Limnocylindrales bacterium]